MDYSTLVQALQDSAARLRSGASYEWGHVGRCNCGHLAQSITRLSDREIYSRFLPKLDEWSEHANEYCSSSGSPIETIFETLERHGFHASDIKHLEFLSDPRVLGRISAERLPLRRNERNDVISYMEALADILSEQKLDSHEKKAA
ncbi:MAG: hypothetical protein KDD64_16275 [Bdellovibrionales bacterium]|nr:hypothetical protein [Bdellovibrionales bacterium]